MRQRVDAQGRAVTVDVVGPGGLLPLAGLAQDQASSRSGYAVGDLLLCVCPRAPMEQALEADAATARDLASLQTRTIERMDRMADARGRPTVVERVASLLCALADCLSPLPGRDIVSADLQHADYGALIAARPETVCRAFGDLERRGLVARSANGVHLLDRAALEGA